MNCNDWEQDMANRTQEHRPRRGWSGGQGAFGEEPTDKAALRRYRDRDQLQPQGYPADKPPTDADATEKSKLPERDKQHGSDDH